MRLLVVESPGKIKKIRSLLGGDWDVKASVGHVRDLPKKALGVGYESGKVKVQYQNSKDKSRAINDIKRAATHADEIFLAMDPDREGEAIAFHVGMILGKDAWPKIRRISFNQITKEAIESALQNPRRIDSALVNAQQARRVVDRLVGFRVSPMLWKKKDAGNSAGRVQSVAVRLITEREREIREFKPQEYWRIKGTFQKESEEFTGELLKHGKRLFVPEIEEGKEKRQFVIHTEETAKEIIAELQKEGQIEIAKASGVERDRKPEPPFITTTLQQAGINTCGLTAAETMKIAQSLYEKGFITYMRTDATTIADSAVKAAREYIEQEYTEEYLPKKPPSYKTKVKNAQEAHECIRPTEITRDHRNAEIKALQPKEKKLYGEIWKRFLASQMTPAKMKVTTVDIRVGDYTFRAKGRQLLFDGWLKLYPKKSGEDQLLPELNEGDQLQCSEYLPKQHFTKPPPRYTEASLVKTLEGYGIGRPSTYASIIDNIKRRGYVSLQKRKFHAEKVGERLVEHLQQVFEDQWFNYEFTAHMEAELDRVAGGDADWNELVIKFDKTLLEKLPEQAVSMSTDKKCEKCGGDLIYRSGKFGGFFGCQAYPKCKFTMRA